MELNRLVAELEKTLDDNLDLYHEMGKSLDEELQALKAYSLPQLDSAIKKKMGISAKLKLIEETRNGMVSRIAVALGIPQAEMSLKKLAEKMGGATESRLISLRSRMSEVIAAVSGQNEFNKNYIEKLMSLNAAAAANLKELMTPESTYQKGGFTPVTAFKPGQVVSRTY